MDFLPSPTGRSVLGEVPRMRGYVWDGGPFLHYACRQGRLESVPVFLRKCGCDVSYLGAPKLQSLEPDEKEKFLSFLQAWLFVGLMAEFAGLNNEQAGDDLAGWRHQEAIQPDQSKDAGIQAVYTAATNVERRDRRAQAALKQAKVSHVENVARHLREELGDDSDAGKARGTRYINYLSECLRFVNDFVTYLDTSGIDIEPSILASISAAGESYVSLAKVFIQQSNLPSILPGIWSRSYLKMHGKAEMEMLKQGWCRSDLEHIRQSFQGLATRHFLSNMRRPGRDPSPGASGTMASFLTCGKAKPAGDAHDSCSMQICNAAQINSGTYILAHDEGCKRCLIIGIDQEEVKRILTMSKTFPILRLQLKGGCGGKAKVVKIYVEEYDENKPQPFVALSHVWADGLGNPKENALQSCQMNRLAGLIRKLPFPEETDDPNEPAQLRYRFWIDTLCCPISVKEKLIALERIEAVYRKAAHVLVLDKSISPCVSKGEGPAKAAENCLRILGTATWMRRLWTLQEGALARSLYFQFKDRAVCLDQEVKRLLAFGAINISYRPIADDVIVMFHKFQSLCSPSLNPPLSKNEYSQQQNSKRWVEKIHAVQSSLFFRNVTVASDEPLCIRTLLSLPPKAMTQAGSCRQQRMAKIWKLVTENGGGRFTAGVIFHNDQRLELESLRGWRWAPKSLLPQLDGGLRYNTATVRFQAPDSLTNMGTVTDDGLKVSFPGMRIALRPWPYDESGTGRVWPWSMFTRNSAETSVTCRHSPTGRWFTILDSMRGEYANVWTAEEWTKRDNESLARDKGSREKERPSQPIFNDLCRGSLYLIQDTQHAVQRVRVYLLARSQETPAAAAPVGLDASLHVHTCRTVYVKDLASSLWPGLDMLRDMAKQVYKSQPNQNLLRFLAQQEGGRDPDPDDEDRKRVAQAVFDEAQRVGREWLRNDQDGHLARVVQEYLGAGQEHNVWKAMVTMVPYDLSAESLPNVQNWVVDGPVVGDGLCHEKCCNDIIEGKGI